METSVRDAQGALVGAGVVGIVIVGGFLLWKVLKPAGETAKNLGETAANLSQAVESVSAGAAALGSGIQSTGQIAGALLGAGANETAGQPSVAQHEPGSPHLQLVVEDQGNWKELATHHTWVTGYVVNRRTRERVSADVRVKYHNALLNAPGIEHVYYPGAGVFDIDNKVSRFFPGFSALGGTGFDIWAEAPGFNPSPVTTIEGVLLA